jgi:universal stress protein A
MPVLSVSAASTPVVDAPPPSMATPAARDARAIVPFGRVLCAANLSEGTQAAVALAQWFAQGHDAELTLLHIVERLSPEDVLDIGRLRLDVVIQERQEQAAARLRALLPHYARMSGQARERVEFGSPAETILDVAREWHADLIVLGVEERSRLSSLLLGSTTRAVVARAAAPVLTATPATAMSWRPVHHYLEAGGVH